MDRIEQFRVAIPDGELRELRDRVRATRWPDQIVGTGWDYGTDVEYLAPLARYC